MAGLAQAIGLARWVFAVPVFAADYAQADAAGRAAIEAGFVLMNQWGGVAIGEHIGQMLSAGWIGLMVALPGRFGIWDRVARLVGAVAALGIVVGLGEGLALALGRDGEIFALATVAGYLGMSLWLVLSGLGMLLGQKPGSGAGQATPVAA